MSESCVCLWLRVRWCLPGVNRGNDEIMKLNCGSAQLGAGRAARAPNLAILHHDIHWWYCRYVVWVLLHSLLYYSSLTILGWVRPGVKPLFWLLLPVWPKGTLFGLCFLIVQCRQISINVHFNKHFSRFWYGRKWWGPFRELKSGDGGWLA